MNLITKSGLLPSLISTSNEDWNRKRKEQVSSSINTGKILIL